MMFFRYRLKNSIENAAYVWGGGRDQDGGQECGNEDILTIYQQYNRYPRYTRYTRYT